MIRPVGREIVPEWLAAGKAVRYCHQSCQSGSASPASACGGEVLSGVAPVTSPASLSS